MSSQPLPSSTFASNPLISVTDADSSTATKSQHRLQAKIARSNQHLRRTIHRRSSPPTPVAKSTMPRHSVAKIARLSAALIGPRSNHRPPRRKADNPLRPHLRARSRTLSPEPPDHQLGFTPPLRTETKHEDGLRQGQRRCTGMCTTASSSDHIQHSETSATPRCLSATSSVEVQTHQLISRTAPVFNHNTRCVAKRLQGQQLQHASTILTSPSSTAPRPLNGDDSHDAFIDANQRSTSGDNILQNDNRGEGSTLPVLPLTEHPASPSPSPSTTEAAVPPTPSGSLTAPVPAHPAHPAAFSTDPPEPDASSQAIAGELNSYTFHRRHARLRLRD